MAEPVTPRDAELVAELNDLLQLDHDALHAYTLAIQAVEDGGYRDTLRRFRNDHERHVDTLEELVRAHGGTAVRGPHLSTGAFKLAIQAAGAVGGDRAVLLAFKANEAQVRDKYQRHARRPHPPQVERALRRAAADEETHYAWVAAVLERMGTGSGTLVGGAAEVLSRAQGAAASAVEAATRQAGLAADRVRGHG